MKITLNAITVSLAAFISIYMFIGFDRVWEFTSGNPDMGPVNFETLKKTPKPNQYLVCPENYCAEMPDTISSSYEISAAKLFAIIRLLIEEDIESKLLASDESARSLRFLSRSPILRFPDTANIQVIGISDTQSALAIYAQAKIGTSDLGVNKTRTDAMIKKLEERIAMSN